MNRLTGITLDGEYTTIINPEGKLGTFLCVYSTQKAVDRLAEYENTGLSPEGVKAIKAERDAAVRDLKPVCEICKNYTKLGICSTCRYKEHFEWRGPQQEDMT